MKNMKTHRLFSAVLAIAFFTPLAALAQTFGTSLSGAAQAPPVANDGSGVAAVTIKGTSVTFSISVKGITTPTLAHIHKAAAGVAGPVVVDFSAPTFTNGLATGTVTTSQDVANDLVANPSSYYVNVHTAEFPAGAVRGQLGPTPQPTATFVTSLSGSGEAPANGAPDGGGVAQVTINGTTVSYTLLVHGITAPTAAHIHRGLVGTAGPVVVGFTPPFVVGVSSGSVTTTPALAAEILGNPSGFYVNVHTAEFPGGAIRAALNPAPPVTTYLPTVVKSAGLNGTSYVSDLRIVNLTSIMASVTIDYFAAGSSATGPAATMTMPVAAGAQAVINDALGSLFATSGVGALRLTSNLPLVVASRVLNDQRPSNAGTTGLLVPGVSLSEAPINGTLALLSNASAESIAAGIGFRTNIGYFNPTSANVTATFRARRNDGTLLGSNTVTISGFARAQQAVFDLISNVAAAERVQSDFYVTYSVDGPLFVYAAVADNKTGDGIYVRGVNAR